MPDAKESPPAYLADQRVTLSGPFFLHLRSADAPP